VEKFMQRAFELAAFGQGNVAPNPMVGCVIVHNSRIIGEGWHRKFGEAHAEVNAIASVSEGHLLPVSTMYVSLEPCNHHGKTPPCTELIINSGIRKVVIATKDPNPLVSGKGIDRLRNAGIEVVVGLLEEAAQRINRRFITFQTEKRPYVILKWAETADRFMDILRPSAELGSFQISGEESHRIVHRWRTEESAILVGAQTGITDNPRLSARLWPGKNPTRIVIDPDLKVPPDSNLLDNSVRTLIFNRLQTKTVFNTAFIQLDFTREIIPDVLAYLHQEHIQSVLVEGGQSTLNHFLRSGLWDEIRIIRSNNYLREGLKAPELPSIEFTHHQAGEDVILVGFKGSEN
jgi:diaminohydroxyphosphoribosylaminopyrimidine deaminase/5-amino-6-(5-phosphoribosylamino)uracil reductase